MVDETKVIVRNNGPLRVEGDNITIADETGKVWGLAGRKIISLCRCGGSENKPFCDGAHNRLGFQSACAASELAPPKPKA
jgi:CDGSH-type Zn-finger protein